MVLASADTKIEDSNENTDKKDTDENGKSNPSYRTLRAFEKICKEHSIIIPED